MLYYCVNSVNEVDKHVCVKKVQFIIHYHTLIVIPVL